MQNIWPAIKDSLKNRIQNGGFHIWIDPIVCTVQGDHSFLLNCPNRFSLSWVRDNYLPLIKEELEKFCKQKVTVQLAIAADDHSGKDSVKTDQQLPLPGLPPETSNHGRLCPRFTFDQFVTGNSNSFAYCMAQAIAQGTHTYNNFLYLISNNGLGKSHLAQAVAHCMLSQNQVKPIIYTTAEEFTNDMVRAFKTNTIEQFKEKYRTNCQYLLLEEIDFLEGKQHTQNELGLLLDRLFEDNKTVIMTSPKSPKDIPKMNNALRSRLNSALIASILPPDYDTRMKIILKKAEYHGISLPGEVRDYLANTITDDIRQLESSVITLAAQSSMLHQPITLDLATEITKYLVKKKEEVTIELIQKVICQYYRVTLDTLKSKSRRQAIAHPRHIAIYLSRLLTKQPLQLIGKEFNRNHATVLHAVNFVQQELSKKSHIGHQVEYITEQIKNASF